MFDAEQTVLLVDDVASSEIAKADMENLGHTIATACNEEEIYTVRLSGDKAYAESIADDVRVVNALFYGAKHELNVEVI